MQTVEDAWCLGIASVWSCLKFPPENGLSNGVQPYALAVVRLAEGIKEFAGLRLTAVVPCSPAEE